MSRETGKTAKIAAGTFAAAALIAMGGAQGLSAQEDPGFLLRTPAGSLGLRVGYAVPRAGSDLFDFTREQLTIDKSDFGGLSLLGELGVRTSERVDVTFGVGYTYSSTRSEFRDWVDADDLPIEQVTDFVTVPVTLGFKAYLNDRGRSVGRFAWIPQKWNPYLGGAVGLVTYRFEQYGEWVDFETLDIFSDNFLSKGTTGTIHLLGGMDMSVNSRLVLTAEARYGWANAELDQDFVGFGNMDLAGFNLTAGLAFRF